MNFSAPESLGPEHRLDGFDSGKPALDEWLVRYARISQASGSARTFVVRDQELTVVAYYSLTVGQVELLEATPRIGKGMGQFPIPVMILARLAVASNHQGCGIGVGLLKDAIRRTLRIAEETGIRAMLTHPIDESATTFYTRFGFEASPLRDRQLLLILKDARRLVSL